MTRADAYEMQLHIRACWNNAMVGYIRRRSATKITSPPMSVPFATLQLCTIHHASPTSKTSLPY